jgi:hypothetical protein
MSKIERGHLLSREPLNAMSKGENAKTDRVLRDDELDAVSGGGGFSWEVSDPSILTVEIGIAPLLETMSEDSCNI